MSSPWSLRPEVAPATSRLLIERAHDEFVAGNVAGRMLSDVRPLVRESWSRSVASAVGPEGLPRLELTAEDLEEYRREHPLAGVMEMVRMLLLPGAAEDSGVVVAVGDAAGRLLWVEGDRRVRGLTGDMGFVAGTNWAETAGARRRRAPRSPWTARCRSVRPSTSTASSSRGRARRPPCTTRRPAASWA